MDDERCWYRYHHLFADLLRQRLHRRYPQLEAELHRRAAAWFAQNELITEAIQHALAGEDFDRAADLIEQRDEAFWMQGGFVTLQHWLAALPIPVKRRRPRLLLTQAWVHFLADSSAATVATLMQEAEDALANADAGAQVTITELQGILATIRAAQQSKQEDIAGIIAYAQQALAQLPPTMGHWRSVALLCLGFAYEMDGAVRAAEQTLIEAIQFCQMIGNLYSALVGTMSLARTRMVEGQLRLAATTYGQALAQAIEHGMEHLPITAQAHINLGRLNYEWNALTLAEQQLQTGLERLHGQGGSWLHLEGYILGARIKQTQRDRSAAHALLQQAEEVAQTIPFQWTTVASAAALVRERLVLGQEAGADQWLAEAQLRLTDDLNRVRESSHLIAVRVLLAQGRAAEALPLLNHITQIAEAAERLKIVVESCILAALVHHQQADQKSAQTVLHKALLVAEPEGYIRSFVDEGETIRQMIDDLRAQRAPVIDDVRLQAYADRISTVFSESYPSTTERVVPPPVPTLVNRKSQKPAGRVNLLEPLSDRELLIELAGQIESI